MHGIFINYRREDAAGFARSLFDRLKNHFGEDLVFMDVSNIEPGLDFVTTINRSLKSCDALLVLIGPSWEKICIERRGEAQDFVAIEVATALERNVRVIPVLVQNATMPDENQLPEELRPLVRRQALLLSNDRFDSDVERLIEVLEKTLGNKFKPPLPSSAAASKTSKFGGIKGVLVGFALAFVALIVIGVAVEDESTVDDPRPSATIPQRLNSATVSKEAPTNQKANNTRQVAAVQRSLLALGYRPGTADGVIGANTLSAIKQFQRSEGLTATGRIDNDLLDALDNAEPRRSTTSPAITNTTETWYDNYGFRVVVQQRGNQINATSFDPYSGMQVVVSSGTLNGNTLLYQWKAANGASGSGVGTLQSDQRHMDLVITDALTGMVQTNQLHKGHLAGQ